MQDNIKGIGWIELKNGFLEKDIKLQTIERLYKIRYGKLENLLYLQFI